MTTVFFDDLTCANCGGSFPSRQLSSTNSFGGCTTDFRVIAAGGSPRRFLIHVCPACGYSGPIEWFERELNQATKERLRPHLRGPLRVAGLRPWTRIERAARIADKTGCSAMEIGDLYLQAAHACTDDGALARAQGYRRRALRYFRRSLKCDSLEGGERSRLTYIVGELQRRLGAGERAIPWFERAEKLAADNDLQWLAVLAARQRIDPEEMLEKPLHPR